MNAKMRRFLIPALAVLAALAGCSTAATQSGSGDQAICQQAAAQARRGDASWSSTLNGMQSMQAAVNCQSFINQQVLGSMNGP